MKPFREAEGYDEDLQAAYDRYKAYSPQSAGRFLAAFEKAEGAIQLNPRICRLRRQPWRQMVISDFPSYSIFYKELSFCWLLGGVLSTLPDPDTIQAKLLVREVSKEQTG